MEPMYQMYRNNKSIGSGKSFDLLNTRVKSSIDSLIPIDNIMPPSAGAYRSFDTLQVLLSFTNKKNVHILKKY